MYKSLIIEEICLITAIILKNNKIIIIRIFIKIIIHLIN